MTPTDIEVPPILLLSHRSHFSQSSFLSLDHPGLGDQDGVGGEQRQLPRLRRPFPDWRPGVKVEALTSRFEQLSCFQVLLPGCEASLLHACHPDCLRGWLAR